MREYFIKLLQELPDRIVVWKTGNGNIVASDMIDELIVDSDISKQYIAEVLRVSRDMVSRKSS